MLALPVLLLFAAAAQAATITVTTTDDSAGPGDCQTADQSCSLRQAVTSASSGDTIQLGGSIATPNVYQLTQGATITVPANVANLTLAGTSPGATKVDDSANRGGRYGEQFRTMTVAPGATVAISGLTFANGVDANDENFQSCSPCTTVSANGGGALYNGGGTVSLSNVAFTGAPTSANPLGGAVSNGSGSLTMTNVSFTSNEAAFGGALFVRGGTVTGTGVTFENNQGNYGGAGAYLWGGSLTLKNTTVVGDGRYAAIANGGGNLTLIHDTFSGDSGGTLQTDRFASTSIGNTILGDGVACVPGNRSDQANNQTTGPAITQDLGHNIDPAGSCSLSGPGDVSNQGPRLAPIADNGGPTRTQALLAGSPAIDAGDDSLCSAHAPNDQRNIARPQGPHCDVGAFEVQVAAQPGGTPNPPQNIGQTQSPSGTTSKPTAVTGRPSVNHGLAAGFTGSVVPAGLVTTAFFEYGLDSRYTTPGTSGPVYDQSTPAQTVGSDSSSHPVSASIPGLVPNALYHVRVVARNGAGTTFGPDVTFTTPSIAPPRAPTIGSSFNVKQVSGLVLININGKFVPLTQLRQIPSGAEIDALHGTLTLVAATGVGRKIQTGTFGGAIFKVTQITSGPEKGLTTLSLIENAFKGAPSYASCKTNARRASAAALSGKVLQLLRGKDTHGKFRTKGRYAAATVRGTVWTIADRCDGTLTHVIKGTVVVNDFVKRITITLRAGHSYLALAKPKKHK